MGMGMGMGMGNGNGNGNGDGDGMGMGLSVDGRKEKKRGVFLGGGVLSYLQYSLYRHFDLFYLGRDNNV